MEGRANHDNLQYLAEVIARGRAMLFAGAGISVDAGYPTWTTLLQLLDSKVRELQRERQLLIDKRFPHYVRQIKEVEDPLWRAEAYKDLLESVRQGHSVVASWNHLPK